MIKPTSLLILANLIKMPGVVLVATLLLGGLDLRPQRQPSTSGADVPLFPVDPGRISFAQAVSYRPLRDSDEKLVDIRWAVSNWRLPSGTSLSPFMIEVGRCAAFKPNFGIKNCLYVKQWWLALIVAWSCVAFLISLCGGVCSTWIDGHVYAHQWHRPMIEGLLWIVSGCLMVYSLSSAWKSNFSYNLKPFTTSKIYVYFKLPTSWLVSTLICFSLALMNVFEFSVVRCCGKVFTAEDLERNNREKEEYEQRNLRRRSSVYGRRSSAAPSVVAGRRKSGVTCVQQGIPKLATVKENGETMTGLLGNGIRV